VAAATVINQLEMRVKGSAQNDQEAAKMDIYISYLINL
jgi:hypothetical protein